MDRRSTGRAVGDLPDLRRKHGLWRRLVLEAQGSERGCVLRANLLRTRGDPASRAATRDRLLRPVAILGLSGRWRERWTMLRSRKWCALAMAALRKPPM